MTSSEPETIMVYVGGDLIGDAVMKLPFLRALKGAWPKSKITWLAGVHKTAFAHELSPLVDGLIETTIEEAGFGSKTGNLFTRPLINKNFDLIIDTQRGVLRSLLIRRIQHKVFISGAANFLFSDRKPLNPKIRPKKMIDQMLKLVEVAYGSPPPQGPPLRVDPEIEKRAAELLPLGPQYIGLAPGAGGQNKRWPLENFFALARREIEKNRVPVAFLGPNETILKKQVLGNIPEAIIPADNDNMGYLKSPMLSIALARRLAAAVANDSGAGHLLAAGDTPLVSLFGPTPPEKFAPSVKPIEIIRSQDFGGVDMQLIPIDVVTSAIDKLLT